MRCPSCNAENDQGDKFCAFCGEDLTKTIQKAEPTVELTPEGVRSSDIQEDLQEVKSPAIEKKKSKVGLVIGLIIAVLIVGAGSVFAYTIFREPPKTPEERLIDGVFDLFEAESGELHTKFKVTDLQMEMDAYDSAMIKDLLSDMVIESVIKYDSKGKRLEGDLDLELLGTTLLTVDYYLDVDYLVVDVPLLYDQAMYFETGDLVAMLQDNYSDDMLDSFGGVGVIPDTSGLDIPVTPEGFDAGSLKKSIERYLDLFAKDQYASYDLIDKTPYKEMMLPVMIEVIHLIEEGVYEVGYDSSITYEGTRYKIDYNQDELELLMEDIVDYMANDENVHNFLEEVITMFIDQIIEEEDYVMYAMLMEKPMDEVTAWEGALYAAELELLKRETIDEMITNLKSAKSEMDKAKSDVSDSSDVDVDQMLADAKLDVTIDLDDEGRIRATSVDVEMDLSDAAEMPLVLAFEVRNDIVHEDMGITFTGPILEGAVNVGAMTEDELEMFGVEVQTNLFQKIAENPMFSDLFNFGF